MYHMNTININTITILLTIIFFEQSTVRRNVNNISKLRDDTLLLLL